MTDEELEQMIREAELARGTHSLPELDAPLGADVTRAIVERFSDVPSALPQTPEPANRAWIGAVAAFLIAAMVVAFLMVPGSTEPLPSYSLTGRTGISDMRSTENAPLVAAPGAPVRLLLRPATRTEGTPEVRATVDGQAIDLETSRKAGGAVEVVLGTLPLGDQVVEVQLLSDDSVLQTFSVNVESRP